MSYEWVYTLAYEASNLHHPARCTGLHSTVPVCVCLEACAAALGEPLLRQVSQY